MIKCFCLKNLYCQIRRVLHGFSPGSPTNLICDLIFKSNFKFWKKGKKEERSYKSSYIIYIVLGKEERASCFLKKLISNCIVMETELSSWQRQTPMTHGCNFTQCETMFKDYLFECMQCWLISLQSSHI